MSSPSFFFFHHQLALLCISASLAMPASNCACTSGSFPYGSQRQDCNCLLFLPLNYQILIFQFLLWQPVCRHHITLTFPFGFLTHCAVLPNWPNLLLILSKFDLVFFSLGLFFYFQLSDLSLYFIPVLPAWNSFPDATWRQLHR